MRIATRVSILRSGVHVEAVSMEIIIFGRFESKLKEC